MSNVNNNNNIKKKSSLSRSSRCESLESVNSNNTSDVILKQQQQYHNQQSHTSSTINNNRHSRTSSNTSNSDMFVNNSIGSTSQNGSTTAGSTQSEAKSVLVVKVNVETLDVYNNNNQNNNNNITIPSTVYYKKICIKDSDRTREVKKLILEKFLMESDKADKYNLVQVFNDGTNSSKILFIFIFLERIAYYKIYFKFRYFNKRQL